MGISRTKEAMRNFAIHQALKYVEGNPDENIPKLMALVDRFVPEDWYVSQRAALREVIEKKNNWYQLALKIYELDAGAPSGVLSEFPVQRQPQRERHAGGMEGARGMQHPVGHSAGPHLGVQHALHGLLGGGVRPHAEPEPGNH